MSSGGVIMAPGMLLAAPRSYCRLRVRSSHDWPRELDSQYWRRCHWIGQSPVVVIGIFGLVLAIPAASGPLTTHGLLGYLVLTEMTFQALSGICRSAKGGPTAPARNGGPDGDHYNMTRRWRIFEALHKSVGYGTVALAAVAILYVLWTVNGQRWMWVLLPVWWALLTTLFVMLQKRGLIGGWGVRRPAYGSGKKAEREEILVRSH